MLTLSSKYGQIKYVVHIHFQKNFLKFLQSNFLKTKYAESRLPKLLIIITSSSFIILSRSGVFFCICILWFINTILKPNVLIFNIKVNIAHELEYQSSSNRIVFVERLIFFPWRLCSPKGHIRCCCQLQLERTKACKVDSGSC